MRSAMQFNPTTSFMSAAFGSFTSQWSNNAPSYNAPSQFGGFGGGFNNFLTPSFSGLFAQLVQQFSGNYGDTSRRPHANHNTNTTPQPQGESDTKPNLNPNSKPSPEPKPAPAPTATKASAKIVGDSNLAEGSKGSYKVQLDQPVTEDTWITVKAVDGTAKRVDNLDTAAKQDIMWGGQYSIGSALFGIMSTVKGRVANGTALTSGDRPQVGPDGKTDWDYTVSKNGAVAQNGELKVLVKAGQTMSESFTVDAWKERVTIDNFQPNLNQGHQEGPENFTLQITGSDGKAVGANDGNLTVTIQDTTQYDYVSPIAFDLNGDGKIGTTGASTAQKRVEGTPLGRTVAFDIDSDGKTDQIEWMKGDGDGLLVDTSKIQNGQINGSALFGDQAGKFANGYEQLAQKDANGDGVISGAELSGLGMWVDDGDGKLEAGELRALADFGIQSINARKQEVQNARGETLMRSDATAKGKTMMTEDVWFGRQ